MGTLLALFVYVPICLFMFSTTRPWRDGLALLMAGIGLIALAKLV
ncbi:hypothetical protein [Erythrobacter sp. QSSC1-22B]|nr:hypothetical protein [Erythrobacter sp. QSSC1-22B]